MYNPGVFKGEPGCCSVTRGGEVNFFWAPMSNSRFGGHLSYFSTVYGNKMISLGLLGPPGPVLGVNKNIFNHFPNMGSLRKHWKSPRTLECFFGNLPSQRNTFLGEKHTYLWGRHLNFLPTLGDFNNPGSLLQPKG